jgi:hypothetical protein
VTSSAKVDSGSGRRVGREAYLQVRPGFSGQLAAPRTGEEPRPCRGGVPVRRPVAVRRVALSHLTALVLAEIAADAGLPPGVLNVLPGAGDVGAAVVGHDGLDKVAFTGSTDVGKQIQRRLAGTGRRLTLELGGEAANIVYDDARCGRRCGYAPGWCGPTPSTA